MKVGVKQFKKEYKKIDIDEIEVSCFLLKSLYVSFARVRVVLNC